MKVISDTELFTLSFNEQKQRLYSSMRGFWPKDTLETLQKNLHIQTLDTIPRGITCLLNFSDLTIMQPTLAEEVLSSFRFLLDMKQVRAVAAVENPEKTLANMQFHRIAGSLEAHAGEYPIGVFTNKDDAEVWLDQMKS